MTFRNSNMPLILAVDTGGTFTDLAAYDTATGRIGYAKSPTTYGDLVKGIAACLSRTGASLAETLLFKHGTTLVINALLQRKGAKTALVANAGFRDIVEIGRGNRPVPFDLSYRRDPPLVERAWRLELRGRLDHRGEEIEALDLAAIDELAAKMRGGGIEAVAISFINSYANPAHEHAAAARLRALLPGVYISCGADLSREWFEYERTSNAIANAFVGPQVGAYIERLGTRFAERGFAGKLLLMASSGGLLSASRAAERPVALIESGPVAGCIGAAALASRLGIERAIAFDMGGTTAKCALVDHGAFDVKTTYYVHGYAYGFPVRTPVVDIVEVSAGGGSIASLDAQGRLQVGPHSAGSEPGPVCYGRGGAQPTVTDANIVLGRLDADAFLGGEMKLDAPAAREAMRVTIAEPFGLSGDDGLDRGAQGVLQIALLTMSGAVKQISIERGYDPRDFTMIAYGGAGPLHASALARELHIPRVIIPPEPGNFAATGMLLADARIDESTTLLRDLDAAALGEAAAWFEATESESASRLESEIGAGTPRFQRFAELRYKGQMHSVRASMQETPQSLRDAFEDVYRNRYGHTQQGLPVELVGLHSVAFAATPGPSLEEIGASMSMGAHPAGPSRKIYFGEAAGRVDTAVYARHALKAGFSAHGPAVIEEYGSTTVIGPFDRFAIGELGEIVIDCTENVA